MQIIPASTNSPSQSSTSPTTATDSSEPPKTSGDAGEATTTATTPGNNSHTPGDAGDATATATTPGNNSHTPGDAGDASATEQSHNALTPKAPSSLQESTDPGQVSNENNDSEGTSNGTGVPALNAQGVAASSPNPVTATTPVSCEPTVAASSPSTQTTTPEVNAEAPNIAATTPKPATKWAPWSLLSGIFSNRLTTIPETTTSATTAPATIAPATTTTSEGPVVNNPMQTLSLPGDITVAVPVTTGGNQQQQTPTTSDKKAKRKRHQASALSIMRQKRIRPTIIDDRVALSVLKELGMTRAFLEQGKILAWALQPDDIEFSNIYDYVARSQDSGPGVKIISIIRVIPRAHTLQEEDGPEVSFSSDSKVVGKLRKMLWHGTKQRVVASILENGLRLPEHQGYFGRGIYFADRISNSALYTENGWYRQGIGYLLLCDVLLGEVYEASSLMIHLKEAPQRFDLFRGFVDCNSVRGCGCNVPNETWNMEIDGCTWPLGPTVYNPFGPFTCAVTQNEFIIFDTKQVQPKYLVKVEFSQNPIHERVY